MNTHFIVFLIITLILGLVYDIIIINFSKISYYKYKHFYDINKNLGIYLKKSKFF